MVIHLILAIQRRWLYEVVKSAGDVLHEETNGKDHGELDELEPVLFTALIQVY